MEPHPRARPASRLARIGWLGLLGLLPACALDASPDEAGDGPLGEAASAQTVQQATAGCNSHLVDGLTNQIFAYGNCISPGAYVPVPDLGNVSWEPGVFHLMEQPARDAFVGAMNANGGMGMHVNSMLRSVAEQYVLWTYLHQHRCGITAAATPGSSNHESGLAMDIQNHAGWNGPLSAYGFVWYGSADPVHFDYKGPGSVDHRGVDVQAFQQLWNLNNPGDPIAEDGQWGNATMARLAASPAEGFPVAPDCNCECSAGQTQTEACTGCGSHTRGCDGCSWGDFGTCVGPPEVCDGVDNDCNGLVDEGHPQTFGPTLPDYAAKLVDLSAPQSLERGEHGTIWADFRNVGAKDWPQGGLWLSARGQDADGGVSALASLDTWPAWNVAAVLDQPVSAGEIGRFTFEVIGPSQGGGEIAESFQLQVPGGSFIACPTADFTSSILISPREVSAGGFGGAPSVVGEGDAQGGCSTRPGTDASGWGAALSLALLGLMRARRARSERESCS